MLPKTEEANPMSHLQ